MFAELGELLAEEEEEAVLLLLGAKWAVEGAEEVGMKRGDVLPDDDADRSLEDEDGVRFSCCGDVLHDRMSDWPMKFLSAMVVSTKRVNSVCRSGCVRRCK